MILSPSFHVSKPSPHLFFDILNQSSSFYSLSANSHLLSIMSFGLNYFILQSPPHLLPPPNLIKALGLLMAGGARWLSWSAPGFALSSSANVIRAISANTQTHTHFSQLKTNCYIRWPFPFRGLYLEIYIAFPVRSPLPPPPPCLIFP